MRELRIATERLAAEREIGRSQAALLHRLLLLPASAYYLVEFESTNANSCLLLVS